MAVIIPSELVRFLQVGQIQIFWIPLVESDFCFYQGSWSEQTLQLKEQEIEESVFLPIFSSF